MNDAMVQFMIAFLIGCAGAAVLAAPVMRGLGALRSRQTVSDYAPEGHQAKQGTPTMGGLMVLGGAAAAVLVLDWSARGAWTVMWMLGFAAIGFADDYVVPRVWQGKRGLGWKQKIVPQAALAALGAPLLGLPATPAMVALVALVVMFFCNAYNFSDGLDGLAGTLGVVLAGGLALLGGHGLETEWGALVAGSLAGALVPFLMLNAHPARVFMGDVGSLPIGALFGLVACHLLFELEGTVRTGLAVPLAILSFVMVAELVPVPLQVLWVKLFKKRLFPYTPIHHAFERRGWPETRVVAMFVLVQLVAVAVAVVVGMRA